jgi:FtsZ-interacting cell division protein ZipA
MPRQQFQGLTLFAVLPGPVEAVQTFDGMIRAAVGLAKDLRGTVQDSTGVLLTPLRLEELREDVARFQAMLTID